MLQTDMPAKGEEIAVMHTDFGDIKIKFFPDKAPKAVENFVTHSKNGYYDNLTFHRIIDDFMIQGGDPLGMGYGGESIWGKPFEDEFDDELYNIRGALSMANSGPCTNGSQFFIVQKKALSDDDINYMKANLSDFNDEKAEIYSKFGGTPWLDGHHTVFGYVFEGMDVVDDIARVKVNRNGAPIGGDVHIKNIEIIKF